MFTFIMFIDKRSFMIGLCVGIIIMTTVGLINAISYKKRIEILEEEIKFKDTVINRQRLELWNSRENCTQLASRLKLLEMNNSELVAEIRVLKRAVLIVGKEEIGEALVRYAEVSLQYDKLQSKYDELVLKYNTLLTQVP